MYRLLIRYALWLTGWWFSAGLPVLAQSIDGVWQATLPAGSQAIRIVCRIHHQATDSLWATIESPDRGGKPLPVSKLRWQKDSLWFRVESLGVAFEGQWQADYPTIRGLWQQAHRRFPLTFYRTSAVDSLQRPQQPQKPYPYQEQAVRYPNPSAGLHLAGTLTLPAGKGPFPAVLLLSGSGPQDRDGTLHGHKPFWVLADYLTRQGLAVLRVDDRGTGQSTGQFNGATLADFALDAQAGIDFLKQHPSIRPGQIGLIGASEGGLVAPLVASRTRDVAFLMLLAAPALRGDSLLLSRIRSSPAPPNMPLDVLIQLEKRKFATMQRIADDSLAAATYFDEAQAWLATLPSASRPALSQPNSNQAQMIGALRSRVFTPWMRFFVQYDPLPALQQLRCPVLALYGSRDEQVPGEANARAMSRALSEHQHLRHQVEVIQGLNHFLQTLPAGSLVDSQQIQETIAPQVLQRMSDWFRQLSIQTP